MRFLLVLLFVVNGLSAISLLAQWIALRCGRISDANVTLFFGPTITSFSVRGTLVSIGCIPTGGSIEFDIEDFGTRNLGLRLAMRLSGVAVIFLIASILLGFPAATHHFASGFGQLISGALHPRNMGVALINRLWEISRLSPLMLIGIVATKLVAISLLPLGPSTMTQCLLEFSKRGKLSRAWEIYAALSAIAVFMLFGSWVFTACLFAAQSSAP